MHLAGGPERWHVISVCCGGRHSLALAVPDNEASSVSSARASRMASRSGSAELQQLPPGEPLDSATDRTAPPPTEMMQLLTEMMQLLTERAQPRLGTIQPPTEMAQELLMRPMAGLQCLQAILTVCLLELNCSCCYGAELSNDEAC